MKITGMTVYIFEPRPSPYQEITEYTYDPWHQNGVAVVHTDEGIAGVASSRSDRLLALAKVFAQAKEQVIGQDPLDRTRLNRLLARRYHCPAVVLGTFDYALWDIAGKRLGLPVYKLIGASREKVAAYGSTMHHGSDERFLEVVDHALGLGLRAIKLHPYGVARDDVRLCERVRAHVGDGIALMLDSMGYPGPYDRADAFYVAEALDALGFHWFEDPLHRTDLLGLAELRRACKKVKIRMADRVADIREYEPFLRHQCMDIMAGPGFFGITDLLKLAHLAEAHQMKMEPHDFGGGTASLHVLLAIHNADYYELAVPLGCLDTRIYPGVYLDPVLVDSEGFAHAPTKPGLGFEIDLDAARNVSSQVIEL